MAAQDSKQVVREFVDRFVHKDVDGSAAFLSSDVVVYASGVPQPMNFDAYKQFGRMYLAAFPDLVGTIEEQIAEGDKVVTCITWRGTHQGALLGIPPTGRRVEVRDVLVDHFRDGKIIERYEMTDNVAMLQQLGAMQAPATA